MSNINLDLQASLKMLMLLDEANANTESVIDQIPGIFLIINENHEILRSNQGFLDLAGLNDEEAFRLPLSSFLKKENWIIFAHHIKQIADSPSPSALVRFEMNLLAGTPDSSIERTFHWTLTKRNVKNRGEGQLICVFGDDISDLRETERRLTKVFTSIPLGIFTLQKDGRIGDSYSSYLETMLDQSKLEGADFEEILFGPSLPAMDSESVAGIEAIRGCLGRSELDYEEFAQYFPREIYRNTTSEPESGRWFRISYQPIIFDHVVDQLLIILENRTAIVNAEKETLEAAKDKGKAIALEKQSLAMYENAIRDPLTGLYTRLYMKDAVAALLWSHDHHDIPDLSLVIFDIDHFKKINDTHGHNHGDRILGEVGKTILRQSKEPIIPIRFGGEEFVVFMPNDCKFASAFAERIREEIEGMSFILGSATISVTVSGGITPHRKNESLDDFMHRADKLLYKAKNNGRNQTQCDC